MSTEEPVVRRACRGWRSSSSWRCCSVCPSRRTRRRSPRSPASRWRPTPPATSCRRPPTSRCAASSSATSARSRPTRRGRDHRAGDRPRPPRPDPRRRQRAAAAQDAVRRAVRVPRAAGATRRASGWPTATSSARTAPRTPSSCSGSSTTRSRCCRPCSPRTSRSPSARSPTRCAGRGDELGREPGRDRRVLRADQHRPAGAAGRHLRRWPTSPRPTTAPPTTCSRCLDNLRSPTRPWWTRRSSCAARSPSATSSSNVTADFLEPNERNLISLAETSRPVLGLFAEYSPSLPLPARRARPVRAPDRRDVRDRRRPGAEPEHPVHLPAAQPLRARATSRPTPTRRARLPRAGQHRRRDRRRRSRASTTARTRPRTASSPPRAPCAAEPACYRGGRRRRRQPGQRARGRAGQVAARRPGRLDRRAGLRAQHPRVPDRVRARRGLRPGRRDAGAAPAREAA